jgi:hypothetical protein
VSPVGNLWHSPSDEYSSVTAGTVYVGVDRGQREQRAAREIRRCEVRAIWLCDGEMSPLRSDWMRWLARRSQQAESHLWPSLIDEKEGQSALTA